VVHPVGEGVFEAGGLHRAVRADALGDLDSDPVIREKDRRIEVFALPRAHPVGVHRTSSDMQILPVDLTAIPVPRQAFTRLWRLFNKPTLEVYEMNL
jgi:hypothetical protein